MRIRIADRVLIAIAGLLLIVISGALIAQTFLGAPVLTWLGNLLFGGMVVPCILAVLLLALSGYCIALAFSRHKGKSGFVLQETEGGELSIALSAVDSLVCQCVQVHEEMELVSSLVQNDRDGIRVELRVTLATGVSVPLAVDALQKQIRQYVTSCSGVTVHEVCVQVDSMENQAVETPYAVPTMLASAVPMLPHTDAENAEREDKLMHQRIFSTDEVPAAAQPVETVEEEAAEIETPAVEETEEAAEEVPAAESADVDEQEPESSGENEPEPDTDAEPVPEATDEENEEAPENVTAGDENADNVVDAEA